MLPIILALFDRAAGDRSRPTALQGQFGAGGPSRSEVRSDLNIIVRRSESPLATKPRRARLSGLARQNDPVKNRPASELPAPPCLLPAQSRVRLSFQHPHPYRRSYTFW